MLMVALLGALAPPVPDVPKGASWREQLRVTWVPKESWVGDEVYVYEDRLVATAHNVIERTRKLTENTVAGEKQPLPSTSARWFWTETWKSPAATRDKHSDFADQREIEKLMLPRWPTKEWTQQNNATWSTKGWSITYDDFTHAPRHCSAELTGVLRPGGDRSWRLVLEMKRIEE